MDLSLHDTVLNKSQRPMKNCLLVRSGTVGLPEVQEKAPIHKNPKVTDESSDDVRAVSKESALCHLPKYKISGKFTL